MNRSDVVQLDGVKSVLRFSVFICHPFFGIVDQLHFSTT